MVEKKTTKSSVLDANKKKTTASTVKEKKEVKAALSDEGVVKEKAKKTSSTKPVAKKEVSLVNNKSAKMRLKDNKKSSNQRKALAVEKAKKHPEVTPENGIVIEQYRSSIRQPEVQRQQLKSLGLGKVGKKKLLPNIPLVSKLIDRLKHLVRIVK